MRMERVAREAEHALMFLRPPLGDEFQVEIRIGTINLVADDRMPDMREMDAQLVLPARVRLQSQE